MKLSVNTNQFSKALAMVATIADRRSTMPILSFVLLDFSGSTVSMTATDLEISQTSICDADIDEPGQIAVNAKTLLDIVKSMPHNSVIDIKMGKSQLLVSCGKSRFRIATMPAEKFPEIPKDSGIEFSIEASILNGMISRTAFAMSIDQNRMMLNGVNFKAEDGFLSMAATDTHRVGTTKTDIDPDIDDFDIIIPFKAIGELKKTISAMKESTVDIIIGAGFLTMSSPGQKIITKLVQGQFPDLRRIMPKYNQIKIEVDRVELVKSVKMMLVLTNQNLKGIKIEFVNNRLTVSVANPDNDQGESEFDIEYTGENMTIGFSGKYLLDTLTAMVGKDVLIELKNDESPVLLTDPNDSESVYVLMPLRV